MSSSSDEFVVAAALEAATPEQQASKRAHLLSRIEHRWAFNKHTPDHARKTLTRLTSDFRVIQKTMEYKRFNKDIFSDISAQRCIPAKLMLLGLSEIVQLPKVFEVIATQAPSEESSNLPKFKALVRASLKNIAPSYGYSGYSVNAAFVADRTLVKKTKMSSVGYNATLIAAVDHALVATKSMITTMDENSALIHKLSEAIVEVLMGPRARDYVHARRQYELVCMAFTSIATLAPFQYLNAAMPIVRVIAQCYD